jgi:hypothetical protein
MKTLARALIETSAFLELSGDNVVNPDANVAAMEGIATALRSASPEELQAIRQALRELTETERRGLARQEVLRFYEDFWDGFGLPEDGAEA